MQIKRRPMSRKKVVLIAVAVILLAAAGGGALYAAKLWPFNQTANTETNKIDLSAPTDEVKDAGNAVKEQVLNSGESKPGSTPDRAVVPEAPAGSKSDSGLRITSAIQSDDQIVIRTLIPVLTGQGTCELSMEGPNEASYTASVPVQAMASSSTCAGYNVPVSKLSPGNWSITVTLNNENLSGSDTGEVAIK